MCGGCSTTSSSCEHTRQLSILIFERRQDEGRRQRGGLCLSLNCTTVMGLQYRAMGELRSSLPEVPFMACTATATPAVQNDIASSLRLKSSAKRCALKARPCYQTLPEFLC